MQIEIDHKFVPEGFEPARVGVPEKDEWYVGSNRKACQWPRDEESEHTWLILRKLPAPVPLPTIPPCEPPKGWKFTTYGPNKKGDKFLANWNHIETSFNEAAISALEIETAPFDDDVNDASAFRWILVPAPTWPRWFQFREHDESILRYDSETFGCCVGKGNYKTPWGLSLDTVITSGIWRELTFAEAEPFLYVEKPKPECVCGRCEWIGPFTARTWVADATFTGWTCPECGSMLLNRPDTRTK